MRLFRCSAALLLFFMSTLCAQQPPETVVFTASKIMDSSGSTPLGSGSICALTTDQNNVPMGYRMGANSGQTSASVDQAHCATITAGAISPMYLINSAASSPANACIRIVTKDASGNIIRTNKCVQTGEGAQYGGWCAAQPGGGLPVTCNWDQYPVGTLPAQIVSTGPPGPAGPAGTSSTTTSNGSSGNFAVSGTKLKIGSTGLADYPTSAQSSQDPAVTSSVGFTDANIVNAGSAFAHGFADNNTFNRSEGNCTTLTAFATGASSPGCAYAGFDMRTQYLGSHNFNHMVGFQAAQTLGSGYTGTTDQMYGFLSNSRVYGGHANNVFGLRVSDTSLANGGTVSTQYGVYVDPLVAGAANWGLYVKANPSFLGGSVDIHNPAADTGTGSFDGSRLSEVELHADATDTGVRGVFAAFGSHWTPYSILLPSSVYFASGSSMANGLFIGTEYNSGVSNGTAARLLFGQKSIMIGGFLEHGGLCLGTNCADDHGGGTLSVVHLHGGRQIGGLNYVPTTSSPHCVVTGEDLAFTVQMNVGASTDSPTGTACVVNFALPYDSAPRFGIGWGDPQSAAFSTSMWATAGLTSMTISVGAPMAGSTIYTYHFVNAN